MLDTCVLPAQSLSSTLTHTSICSTAPLSLHKQSCSLTRQGQRLLLLFIAATAGAIAGTGARHWIEAWPASCAACFRTKAELMAADAGCICVAAAGGVCAR